MLEHPSRDIEVFGGVGEILPDDCPAAGVELEACTGERLQERVVGVGREPVALAERCLEFHGGIPSLLHFELVAAIREAYAGGRPIGSDIRVLKAAHPPGDALLSPREIEVLGLMREGFTNNDIGRLLGISTRTAKAHVAAIIEKLGVVDRTQAVARAFDLGLLKAAPPKRPSSPAR